MSFKENDIVECIDDRDSYGITGVIGQHYRVVHERDPHKRHDNFGIIPVSGRWVTGINTHTINLDHPCSFGLKESYFKLVGASKQEIEQVAKEWAKAWGIDV